MAIDMRFRPPVKGFLNLHVYRRIHDSSVRDDYSPGTIGVEPPPSAVKRSMELLFQEMDEADIRYGVMPGRQAIQPFGGMSNEDIYELVDAYPDRLLGLPILDANDVEGAMAELERAARHPRTPGVHMEPGWATVPLKPDDRSLYPLFARAAELELVVAISGGGTIGPDFTYVDPITVQHIARDFPRLRVVICHGGWPWVLQALAVAYTCPNVYLSPDMYLNVPNMPGVLEYVRAANFFLEDRLLFGTAYPVRPLKESIDYFRQLPFDSTSVVEKVLYHNAAPIFGL